MKFLDYRDLKDKYDAIASIEMIEAVGEKYLDKYFSIIKNNLKPNGVGAIQAIIIKDELFLEGIDETKILFKNIFFLVVFCLHYNQSKIILKKQD